MTAPEHPFWSLTLSEIISIVILIVTVIAIVYGPIWAVRISAEKDELKDRKQRKLNIISGLMRTRKYYMHQDHVFALNLVQLEFYDHSKVVDAFKRYIDHLSLPVPAAGNDLDNFLESRTNLFFDMLHAMVASVGLEITQDDLKRFAYVPYGWSTEQEEVTAFRKAILDLLNGRRALPVVQGGNFPPAGATNPFPPPPAA